MFTRIETAARLLFHFRKYALATTYSTDLKLAILYRHLALAFKALKGELSL